MVAPPSKEVSQAARESTEFGSQLPQVESGGDRARPEAETLKEGGKARESDRPDTAEIIHLDTERARRASSLDAAQTPTQTLVLDTNVQKPKTPLWKLDVWKWDSSRSGNGYAVRFRLKTPDPDTGLKSRYHCWVRLEEYEQFKRSFSIEKAIRASRNAERLKQLVARKS